MDMLTDSTAMLDMRAKSCQAMYRQVRQWLHQKLPMPSGATSTTHVLYATVHQHICTLG